MMFHYNDIEEALTELKRGKLIMCTDDPERENEGDLICAAEFATTANINFMASQAKGLICMPDVHRLHQATTVTRKWYPTTRTPMKQHLQCRLIMYLPLPVFLPWNVRLLP